MLEIDNGGRIKTALYDKSDDLTSPIVNFLSFSNNIKAAQAYGAYISQHIHHYMVCAHYILIF